MLTVQKKGGGWGATLLHVFSCCKPKSSPAAYPLSDTAPLTDYLLPEVRAEFASRSCLVLDLDETLVHSSFKPVPDADFIVPVDIDEQIHQVYVLKRPGVDEFMKLCGELFEVVVFTASLSKYADPVLDLLDVNKAVHQRLFREGCVQHQGSFVKDLGRLGRPLARTCIVDNSPASYLFHPQNAIPIETWFDNPADTELLDLMPFLRELAKADDMRPLIAKKYGHRFK